MRRMWGVAAILVAVPAHGNWNGWGTGEEIESRRWTTATIDWARSFHPGSPSSSWVAAQPPPPREMWCRAPDPWEVDCASWSAAMQVWILAFAGSNGPGVPPPPQECPSSCAIH